MQGKKGANKHRGLLEEVIGEINILYLLQNCRTQKQAAKNKE